MYTTTQLSPHESAVRTTHATRSYGSQMVASASQCGTCENTIQHAALLPSSAASRHCKCKQSCLRLQSSCLDAESPLEASTDSRLPRSPSKHLRDFLTCSVRVAVRYLFPPFFGFSFLQHRSRDPRRRRDHGPSDCSTRHSLPRRPPPGEHT